MAMTQEGLRQHLFAGAPIPLDRALFLTRGLDATHRDIRDIVRSVQFEILEKHGAVRLLGPDMRYHNVDPHLPKVLEGRGMTIRDVLSYKSANTLFDLCFEDSWSGYFISETLSRLSAGEDLVVIHLDDHTDMMPTLLARAGDTLVNPVSDCIFDPANPADWESAIYSGCVSIGNFITPLYYSGRQVHVRHLNNGSDDDGGLSHVIREGRRYELIPDRIFASICKTNANVASSAGTYLGGPRAQAVLDALPQGRIVVHIDLDYFINDFNGNASGHREIADLGLKRAAQQKMDIFFAALTALRPNIDQWIIATSPGFCSARHWDWLLGEIGTGIRKFRAR